MESTSRDLRDGIRVAMITGDSRRVADSVARIDEVAAEVLHADKATAGERFQAGGKKVAMVSDGVDDVDLLSCALRQITNAN